MDSSSVGFLVTVTFALILLGLLLFSKRARTLVAHSFKATIFGPRTTYQEIITKEGDRIVDVNYAEINDGSSSEQAE